MIQRIQASDYAQVCFVVANTTNAASIHKGDGIFAKLFRNRGKIIRVATRKLLEIAYGVLIERKTFLPDSDEKRDLKELLAGVPIIEARPARRKWSERYSADDLRRVREFDPDVLVRMGSRVLKGDILEVARYGVWSYHHADNLINRGGPAGFWESMLGRPETGCIVQILTDDLDNGTVLYRSFSCTNDMSVLDNRRNYFWKSSSFLPRCLRDLYELGSAEFFRRVAERNAHPMIYSRQFYRQPTNAEYARLVGSKIVEKGRMLWRHARYRPQWILLYDVKPEMSSSLWRYKRLMPPHDRFWADPHAVEWCGRYYLFIEEYMFATGKGHIAVMIMDDAGNWSDPTIVLERPYHLSYPFIFRHDGQFYMIPESAENSTIELYRCVDFPYSWEFQENLMSDVKAYDTTLAFHEGKCWLFANMIENPGASSCDELFLFHSDRPFGSPWTPHPMNPIVSDCKSARPAGNLFSERGQLYRPAQDCSGRYGRGFVFTCVEVLNEQYYREVVVSHAGPDWAKDVIATHTFNRAGALNVIDAQILAKKPFLRARQPR
ncbi:MAG: hypothetical protein WB784_02160 [Rhodanobacteraceae bacterium]